MYLDTLLIHSFELLFLSSQKKMSKSTKSKTSKPLLSLSPLLFHYPSCVLFFVHQATQELYQFIYMSNQSHQKASYPLTPPLISSKIHRPFLRPSSDDLPSQNHKNNQQIQQNTYAQNQFSIHVLVAKPREGRKMNETLCFQGVLLPQKQKTCDNAITPHLSQAAQKVISNQSHEEALKESLINTLLHLQEEPQVIGCTFRKKKKLQELHAVETESQSQDDSDGMDQHSEVVELSEQEQYFFNNFIVGQEGLGLDGIKETGEQGKCCHKNKELKQCEHEKNNCTFNQKKKVIRNFFRPKASFFKDDKTRCNSQTNLQQICDSPKRNLLSSSQQSQKVKI